MQLQLDHLYQIITQEAFCAADRFAPVIMTANEQQYDIIVKNMAHELKSIVMWDGEIEEGARQSMVSHVVARTHLTDAMHDDIDRAFWDFAQQNASESFQEILKILMQGSHKISALYSIDGGNVFEKEWLYGPWMSEYALQAPLANLSLVHRFLDLTDQEDELKGDARAEVIRKKLSDDTTGNYSRLFDVFMKAFENNPHKNTFINRLGRRHLTMILHRDPFDFNDILGEQTIEQLHMLRNEIYQLWRFFGDVRVDMLSKDLAQTVRLRCNSIMKTMIDAPIIEPTAQVSVAVDKTSIEQFRSKGAQTPIKGSSPT